MKPTLASPSTAFQRCLTGDTGVFDPLNCARFDRDRNTLIDEWDLLEFENCATGPEIPLDPEDPPVDCDL